MAKLFLHTLFMSEIIYILVLLQYSNLKDTLIRIVYVFSYKNNFKKTL